jgi:molybdopterin-guanine dinucleotide biosynthesis protein A
MIIHKDEITGLVLAGGRGTRMGGVDKGLQTHLGIPLALHALERLRPQVAALMINANRNFASYEAMGVSVWPDEIEDYPGPLAGMLAGLAHCDTPYLATVPCDTPNFPTDLVARLAEGLMNSHSDIAVAYTREDGALRAQPVFCLMRTSLRDSLSVFVAGGERKTGLFAAKRHGVKVEFNDAAAFANANTLSELAQLQLNPRPP